MGLNEKGGKGRALFFPQRATCRYFAAYSVDFNTWLESEICFFLFPLRLASVCAWMMQAGLQLEVCAYLQKLQ